MDRLGFIHIALEMLDRGSQKVETQFTDGDSLYKVTIEKERTDIPYSSCWNRYHRAKK